MVKLESATARQAQKDFEDIVSSMLAEAKCSHAAQELPDDPAEFVGEELGNVLLAMQAESCSDWSLGVPGVLGGLAVSLGPYASLQVWHPLKLAPTN